MSKKLIESELPLSDINRESATDKRTHDGHISTLHTWWARRPLPMARAMTAASLLEDPGDRRDELLDVLSAGLPFKGSAGNNDIKDLRRRIEARFPNGARILDCFGGGGAIPLESLRLGCATTSLDLNPVAHLIQKGSLEFPQRFGTSDERGRNRLRAAVEYWGTQVAELTSERVSDLYPRTVGKSKPPPYYFWVRTMPSPDPTVTAEIPILSSRVLAEGRRNAWITLDLDPAEIGINVHQGTLPDDPTLKQGFESAGSVTCPVSGTTTPQRETKEFGKSVGFGYRLYAVCEVDGQHRTYRAPTSDEAAVQALAAQRVQALEGEEFDDGTSVIPDELVDEIGYNNLQFLPYGYATWRSLFTDRQLVLYAELSRAIREANDEMIAGGMEPEMAKAVSTYLGFVMDKVADRNSAFSSWQTGGEKIRGTFPGQTVQMRWDFCENYPFRGGSGSWNDALEAVCKVIEHCSLVADRPAQVLRGNAQDMPFEDGEFDAVLIDPPYYYSVMYADLSDFFYVLLKRSIGGLYPEHFQTQRTPKSQEIVQNRCAPSYDRFISEEEFDRRLAAALSEVARVVKDEGVVSIVFAHTDVRAWEKLLKALRSAGLTVTTSWPIRSEMEGRPVAHVKAALASSVILVCRPNLVSEEGFYDDVVRRLESVISERLDTFEQMGLHGADYFVSAVGPAFEVFAQHRRVVRLSGDEVTVVELMALAQRVVARHAIGRLLGSETIAVLDERSLFYLTWRWAYLTVPIPADDAIQLSRAFGIDLQDLTGTSGILNKTGKTFALRGPHERRIETVSQVSPLIDILQHACRLHEEGRRAELVEVLGETSAGNEPAFWDMASALAEMLHEDSRERAMLLGLLGGRERIVEQSAELGSSQDALF